MFASVVANELLAGLGRGRSVLAAWHSLVSSLVSVSGHFRGGEGVGLFELTSCLRGGNESQARPGFLICEKEDADGTWILHRTAGRKKLMNTATA